MKQPGNKTLLRVASAPPHPGALTIIPGLGVDVPELRQARARWQIGRFSESLELFEGAVRKYPQNLVAMVDASRALGARFEITRAEAILDRLMRVGKSNPQVLHLAGQSYRMIFRPEKAIRCFESALASARALPETRLELAVLFERRHRLAEAFQLLEDCLHAEPDFLEAELFKGRLLRRLKDAAGADAQFRRLATNEQADPLVRAQAWNEIAQRQDQEGDFDGAVQSLHQSKQFLLAEEGSLRQESEALQFHLHSLAHSLTRAHFEKWAAEAEGLPQQRQAVLCSFPRSGTTLLEQVLDSHPGLVSSDEREAFGRDIFPELWRTENSPLPTPAALDAISRDRLASQRTRYHSYMSAALNETIGERVHLDKNPTMTPLIPGMLRLFPETRLLIALRDPRDVVISCFMQYLPLNPNSVSFLTLERTARRYAHDLEIWLKLRQSIPAPWIEVKYEQCVLQLESEARRCLAFLDLPWAPEVLQYRERMQGRAVSSPTYEAVSQPLYTSAIGRWKNYRKHLEPFLEILAPMVAAFGYDA